jgi:hypothetical protein
MIKRVLYLLLTIKYICLNDKSSVEASLNRNDFYNQQLLQHQHNHYMMINRASHYIEVAESNCFNETCYSNMSDIFNSPLVQCDLLYVNFCVINLKLKILTFITLTKRPEQFYECESIFKKNSTNNCTKVIFLF